MMPKVTLVKSSVILPDIDSTFEREIETTGIRCLRIDHKSYDSQ